jgi:ribose transport system ATP-binding protein
MDSTLPVLLEVKSIDKRFGPTVALKNVDIKVRSGEIRGLVGENGSGKSTLTSIIAGMQKADRGEMFFLDQKWEPASMIAAQRNGISMILQEMNTISGVSVAENLFAGQEEKFAKFGIVSYKKMVSDGDKLLKRFGIEHIKASDPIDLYGFEDRKLIEIARTVTEETKILVVDETTTALSHTGREFLYKLIKKMTSENKAVIFISHDMDEILEVCNVLTVLRDGDIIGHLSKEEMDPKKIRYMMVGREIGEAYYRDDYNTDHGEEVVLEFKNASFESITDFSLKLHRGEIIGIGGLSGSGMRDIGRAAFGLLNITSGSIECKGEKIISCQDAIQKGIGYISKNRDTEALILQGSINDNITMPALPDLTGPALFINPTTAKKHAKEQIDLFSIKCGSGSQYVSTLSGGNKQKVSFAKWIGKGSEILVMDCPTRGVDIGVKQSMYQLIAQLKKEGKAILMISEELSELIGMCDEIIIMKDEKVSGKRMRTPDLKETDLIEYMI